MGEMEHLNPEQFGLGDHGFHQTQRYVRSGDGKTYRLQDHQGRRIAAYSVTDKNSVDKQPNAQARVGMITAFGGRPTYDGSNTDGGVIYKASVRPRHQRKGLATEMLKFARDKYPEADVRHSNALSEDGAAWAAATPTENDVNTVLRRNRGQA